jgi:hypothetical protein
MSEPTMTPESNQATATSSVPAEHLPENTQVTPSKTASSTSNIKPKLIGAGLIIVLSSAVASYFAYEQGMIDPYLPEMLHKRAPTTSNPIQVEQAPTNQPLGPIGIDTTSNQTPSQASNQTSNQTSNGSINLAEPNSAPTQSNQATAPNSSGVNTPTNPAPSNPAPINPFSSPTDSSKNALSEQQISQITRQTQAIIAHNNTQTNALLNIMDIQNQWQSAHHQFNQTWDTAAALQSIQSLKAQLRTLNHPSVLTSISALEQTESQLQAWHQIGPQTHLNTLTLAVNDLPKLSIRTHTQATHVPKATGLWDQFIATLKSLFSIRHINTAHTEQSLDSANAAIILQGIHANLLAAQWAARNGQWSSAQTQLRQASQHIRTYGQGYHLDAVQPLLAIEQFPAMPDFSSPTTALAQARSQLSAQLSNQSNTTDTSNSKTTNAAIAQPSTSNKADTKPLSSHQSNSISHSNPQGN